MSTTPQRDPISGDIIGATKQRSWFKTDVDFENSFKYWFALQWQNWYIQSFVGILALFIFMLTPYAELEGWEKLLSLIPLSACVTIAYKGFYQFFNDMKNGTSR